MKHMSNYNLAEIKVDQIRLLENPEIMLKYGFKNTYVPTIWFKKIDLLPPTMDGCQVEIIINPMNTPSDLVINFKIDDPMHEEYSIAYLTIFQEMDNLYREGILKYVS